MLDKTEAFRHIDEKVRFYMEFTTIYTRYGLPYPLTMGRRNDKISA